jgi:membrane protein YdbS with pleckstrin-like domain
VVLSRKFLNDDEELLVEMRPHWVYIFGPLLTSAVVWIAIGALVLLAPKLPDWTSYPLLAVAAVPAIWLLGRVIKWRCYVLALTSTRIVVRQGVLKRDTVQLRLQRITEINLSQLFWERALGTGKLVIDVQGEDDSVILEYVRKPAIVQRVINSQINELVGGGTREDVPEDMRPRDQAPPPPPASPPPPHDTPPHDTPPFGVDAVPSEPAPAGPGPEGQIRDRLIELDDLRQRGIVSEEEFAAKKAELLNRI